MGERSPPDFDILVVGAGVLGVTIAYWLNVLYDCTMAIADMEQSAGLHASSRNTGVIHRPFYLDPRTKRVFAQSCLASHPMWRRLAETARLPWRQIGTFNVAVDEPEVRTLERYRSWGVENGMREAEMELLDGRGVAALEPEVKCRSGLLSKTDVSVDFGAFTRHLWGALTSSGVRFLGGHRVESVTKKGESTEVGFRTGSGRASVSCRFLVNATGGGAIDIAHACGLAWGYSALHFRGEYWVVEEPFASRVASNIYRPPRFPQFPFLDPHFVVRADGSRQIGPNAVAVPRPYVYSGIGLAESAAFLDPPVGPKASLMARSDFLRLLAGEWKSSLSKRTMCGRVGEFIPALNPGMLERRAVFGVRSPIIGRSGFVPEALLLKGDGSAHVINYNSPGASGAPAYSAKVVSELRSEGYLDGFRRKEAKGRIPGWDYEAVAGAI